MMLKIPTDPLQIEPRLPEAAHGCSYLQQPDYGISPCSKVKEIAVIAPRLQWLMTIQDKKGLLGGHFRFEASLQVKIVFFNVLDYL